jgi:hypothetical protein
VMWSRVGREEPVSLYMKVGVPPGRFCGYTSLVAVASFFTIEVGVGS